MAPLPPGARHRLEAYAEARAPRYTSYPTAVQFGPAVDAKLYGGWLRDLPDSRPVSLYVHIPFCKRLCWYCGCNMRVVRHAETVTDYVKALDRESELVLWTRGRGLEVSTLHLGGGSPDSLSPDDLDRLFASLRYAFALPRSMAFDAELDPAHVSDAWIRSAARHGLTRASLGVQTFAEKVQTAIHRPQSFERVAAVVTALREARVGEINFDLMYGLPQQTVSDILHTLEQAMQLAPERIALFGYAHLPAVKRHQGLFDPTTLPGAAERLEQASTAAAYLVRAGYVQVGFDHFALPSDPLANAAASGGLHRNFQGFTTDEAETLIGLGVSAISRLPQGYAQNHHDLKPWREALAKGRLPIERGVAFTGDDRFRAAIIERLMCDGWVDLDALCQRYEEPLTNLTSALGRLHDFEMGGLVERHGHVIHATDRGRPLIRTICTVFDRYFDPTGGRHAKAV